MTLQVRSNSLGARKSCRYSMSGSLRMHPHRPRVLRARATPGPYRSMLGGSDSDR
jgi:hypothetical protein